MQFHHKANSLSKFWNKVMSKFFVYTKVQLSVPFDQVPWRELTPSLKTQKAQSKTWLSGVQNNSIGGFYEFDSLENAQAFAYDYFPTEAKKIGAAFTTRIFNGSFTEAASCLLELTLLQMTLQVSL
jgi:hypothetical protein